MWFDEPYDSAPSVSGITCANRPMTAACTWRKISQQPATGAGRVAARTLPAGMTKRKGRKLPPLIGVCGSSQHFAATNTPPLRDGQPAVHRADHLGRAAREVEAHALA